MGVLVVRSCHSLDYIQMNAAVMDCAGWEKSVRKMIDWFGAPISDEAAKQITDYRQSITPRICEDDVLR